MKLKFYPYRVHYNDNRIISSKTRSLSSFKECVKIEFERSKQHPNYNQTLVAWKKYLELQRDIWIEGLWIIIKLERKQRRERLARKKLIAKRIGNRNKGLAPNFCQFLLDDRQTGYEYSGTSPRGKKQK